MLSEKIISVWELRSWETVVDDRVEKLFEPGFEVFDEFLRENVRIGKVVGLFEGFVSEPENIEAGFVAVDAA